MKLATSQVETRQPFRGYQHSSEEFPRVLLTLVSSQVRAVWKPFKTSCLFNWYVAAQANVVWLGAFVLLHGTHRGVVVRGELAHKLYDEYTIFFTVYIQ